MSCGSIQEYKDITLLDTRERKNEDGRIVREKEIRRKHLSELFKIRLMLQP
jgi:hypothetical protein